MQIDLLTLFGSGEEDVEVEVGDVITLSAKTEALFLPDIFYPTPQEDAQSWADSIQNRLTANGVHTARISLNADEAADGHREYTVELQATFVGPLPSQEDSNGNFYGYDENGNLVSEADLVHAAIMRNFSPMYFAATAGAEGAPLKVIAVAVAVVAGAGALVLSEAFVAKVPAVATAVQEVTDTTQTVAVAAVVVALLYLLSKV